MLLVDCKYITNHPIYPGFWTLEDNGQPKKVNKNLFTFYCN